MKTINQKLLAVAIAGAVSAPAFAASSISEALSEGKVSGDLRLRYESVEQDNDRKDADAMTLRTRIKYTSGSFQGFSATAEFEDSRSVLGFDDYNAAGLNGQGEYSVIADPEVTEVDQAFLQYKTDGLVAKLGAQVITLDGHRFVGHVGWRQDRQTFDAFTAKYSGIENLTLTYGYIYDRNRIFAEERDVKSSDHLINAAYKTSVGTVTGYAYLLEEEDGVETSIDTVGVSFKGATKMDDIKVTYYAEYATQTVENNMGRDYDSDYLNLEGGIVVNGISAKVGYEELGSGDTVNGFQTPLATLHKFNGWADQFLGTPSQGLEDLSFSVGGKVAGFKLGYTYHSFSAVADSAADDLGSEHDFLVAKKFGKKYSAGIKYAMYEAGDIKVDTDKLWVWVGAKF